jgi:transcription elongation factor Elf1
MNCPVCNANDTARCVMVYSQGTFSGSSSATGSSYQSGYGYSPTHAYGHASGSRRFQFSRLIQEWGATWICLRCGHRWIPEG